MQSINNTPNQRNLVKRITELDSLVLSDIGDRRTNILRQQQSAITDTYAIAVETLKLNCLKNYTQHVRFDSRA